MAQRVLRHRTFRCSGFGAGHLILAKPDDDSVQVAREK